MGGNILSFSWFLVCLVFSVFGFLLCLGLRGGYDLSLKAPASRKKTSPSTY